MNPAEPLQPLDSTKENAGSLQAFYEGKAAHYKTLDSHVGRREERVLRLFPQRPNVKVLDVGCGSGRFLRILKDMGHEAVGVDISREAVETARQSGVPAFVGNLETFDGFEQVGREFDVITLLDVLEHTFMPAALLRGLLPWLKRGGCLIVSVPNIACIHARLTLLVGHFPSRPSGTFDSGHIRWFTRSNLGDYIHQAGALQITGYLASPLPPLARFGLWRLEKSQAAILNLLATAWPSMWGYQHIFRLERI